MIYSLVVFALFVMGNPASAHSQETEPNLRHIELDGQSNLRDIGGYKTIDNQSSKWKTVYRSGELPRLSDKDITKLDALDIATVVNFLTNDEINARGHDRLPKGLKELF